MPCAKGNIVHHIHYGFVGRIDTSFPDFMTLAEYIGDDEKLREWMDGNERPLSLAHLTEPWHLCICHDDEAFIAAESMLNVLDVAGN
jgi:hypothetical protein